MSNETLIAILLDALELARDRLEICNYDGEESDALAQNRIRNTKSKGSIK